MFWMFGAFIIGCGMTHFMEVVTTVTPIYRMSGLLKLVTAAASVATAITLVPLVPKALAMKSPGELEVEIEQRKKAEEELAIQAANLQEHAELLEKANKAKDIFLASMSHELRTPLNAIIGFSGTLLMKLPGPLTAEQESQLKTVQSSANHLLILINDLLDLTKIESGKIEPNVQKVIVWTLVHDVAATLQPLAEAKGLTLEIPRDDPRLTIQTDERLLTQILINLTSNAIKYTDGGSVKIQVDRTKLNGTTGAEIRVIDTGIGIRPEDQAELFEAFTEVGKLNRGKRESTGLGLHLSRKLADIIGAKITCESDYGKGSTFTVSWADIGEGGSKE